MAKKRKQQQSKKKKRKQAKEQQQQQQLEHTSTAPAVVVVAPVTAAAPIIIVEAKTDDLPATTSEHRASQRIRLEVELHLSSDSHFFTGLSGDISEGGLFVSTYRKIARGSQVDMEFSLPGSSRLLHARGEVRWHRDASPDAPPGVGVAFEDVSPEDKQQIQRFCVARPPLYYELD